MIETLQLCKTFEGKKAVDSLSFAVHPGEILGFLGPNGAGKSTTVKMLTGMIHPSAGSATVAGYDITTHPMEVKQRIGYVPESGAMYEYLTPREYLELVGALHHIEPETVSTRSNDLLDVFGLTEEINKRMSEFSKGMKQKVLIAAALLNRPEVLFLDEPLNGLDANAAGVIKELLRRLAEQGKTIFFCSHILEVVERICTRIIIVQNGSIVTEGTAPQIAQTTQSETLEEAFRKLTGVREAGDVTNDFINALDRV